MQKAYKHNIKPNAKKNLQVSVLEKKKILTWRYLQEMEYCD